MSSSRRTVAFLSSLAWTLAAAGAVAATPTHLYLLDDASDAYGGPALTSYGGTFGTNALGQTGYRFVSDQGLSVAGAVDASVYTIDFAIALDQVDGYRRLVEFKNRGSDAGLYNLSSSLNFFPVTSGPAGAFAVGQLERVTITRDAAGAIVGYVNGLAQFAIDDSGAQRGVFSGPDQIAYLFRDDTAAVDPPAAGFADYIRIYDSALSAADVAALTNPVPIPEPAGWLLLSAGLAALAARRRR